MLEPVAVKPGQVWADNTNDDRRVRIQHLEVRDHWKRLVTDPGEQDAPTHARCRTLWWHTGRNAWVEDREVSIKLESFHTDGKPRRSGYRLLSSPGESPCERSVTDV